jgi:hypothetical protein
VKACIQTRILNLISEVEEDTSLAMKYSIRSLALSMTTVGTSYIRCEVVIAAESRDIPTTRISYQKKIPTCTI